MQGHGRDEVQISSFGRDYQIAKQAVTEAADIREDKVAELKAKVNSGNYFVDTAGFRKIIGKVQHIINVKVRMNFG